MNEKVAITMENLEDEDRAYLLLAARGAQAVAEAAKKAFRVASILKNDDYIIRCVALGTWKRTTDSILVALPDALEVKPARTVWYLNTEYGRIGFKPVDNSIVKFYLVYGPQARAEVSDDDS